jgi:hypothetical protein
MSVVLDNYERKCKVTQGRVKLAYIFPYVKYSRSQIKDFEMSLTVFPNPTVVYQFDTEGSYNQNSSVEQGSFFFEQTVTLQLSEVYDVLDIHKFLKVDYRVIVETYNDQLIIFGVRNGLTARVSNQTGTSKNEFNGFTLTLTGKEEKTGLLISSLEDLGFILKPKNGFFQYNFSINF